MFERRCWASCGRAHGKASSVWVAVKSTAVACAALTSLPSSYPMTEPPRYFLARPIICCDISTAFFWKSGRPMMNLHRPGQPVEQQCREPLDQPAVSHGGCQRVTQQSLGKAALLRLLQAAARISSPYLAFASFCT